MIEFIFQALFALFMIAILCNFLIEVPRQLMRIAKALEDKSE